MRDGVCELLAGQLFACFAAGAGVEAGAGLGAVLLEGGQRVAVAQAVGFQLEDRFTAGFAPELLRALDAVVQLFDRGFHVAARDRQALLAVVRVVPARLLVPQVRQHGVHDFPRTGDAVGGGGRAEFLLSRLQAAITFVTWPDQTQPIHSQDTAHPTR